MLPSYRTELGAAFDRGRRQFDQSGAPGVEDAPQCGRRASRVAPCSASAPVPSNPVHHRNENHAAAEWRFITDGLRIKLKNAKRDKNRRKAEAERADKRLDAQSA